MRAGRSGAGASLDCARRHSRHAKHAAVLQAERLPLFSRKSAPYIIRALVDMSAGKVKAVPPAEAVRACRGGTRAEGVRVGTHRTRPHMHSAHAPLPAFKRSMYSADTSTSSTDSLRPGAHGEGRKARRQKRQGRSGKAARALPLLASAAPAVSMRTQR